MRLKNVDLNLFVVFEAIYNERNLTRAAEVLCVTQSAVSNALSRLRKSYNDQLFVRSSKGVSPTPLAENIIGRVQEALLLLDSSLQEGDLFDPLKSDRTFRLSMNDLMESQILKALVDDLYYQAPGISLESHYIRRSEIVRALASGELDFAIDVPLVSDPQLCHAPLYKGRYVCVVRKDHPAVQGSLSMEQYLALKHINISGRRVGKGRVDVALDNLGYQRKIQLRVQHYLLAPQIVQQTDLALTVSHRWAKKFNLQILELPFEVPEIETHLYWHRSVDSDQGNKWLRQRILSFGSLS